MNRATLSWCLYDLANTIFAMNMTSYHFPVWVVSDLGGSELAYGITFGASMAVSALLMPAIGRLSDRGGRRIPGWVGWTILCVVCTSALSRVSSLVVALGLFALANFSYQLAGVLYNALLPAVATPKEIGRISGYGVSLGYVGTVIGILGVAPFVSRWGRQAAFLPTGILFLGLALPSFLLVKENGARHQNGVTGARSETWHPFNRSMTWHPPNRFLWAAFWLLNAVSTVILFMSVYAKEAIHLSDQALHWFLISSTVAAIIGSIGWGWLTDRLGGYRALRWVWGIWAAVFGLAMVSFHPALFWVLGALAGIALGGTWVASRVLILHWVKPEQVGEAFGWFGLVSRLSAILGPIVWGLILWVGEPWGPLRYRVGMAAMLFFVILGGWLYCRIEGEVNRSTTPH